ncbi:uncharacterized protein EI97DRAFT_434754 [Westerdykella ornata]|uniref:M protein, serotype 2.1 n=1 Tax=Westerdykella ornata TaxID=318751 RepID=A0A6A6JE10_WESOR|nr:uncharacterized protein EI97DRAFT_434754 [Westerdykella ornata]KAF2274850.1 hypothetical protein EI97DRAFT_434754 [Westerdykella ornata]
MSSTTSGRKTAGGTPTRDSTAKPSASPGAANRTPSRASTPTANSPNGVQRTRSMRTSISGPPVSARAAVRKPGASSNLSMSSTQANTQNDDDARDEAAAYIQELKDRLQKAENEAEERQKQIDVLNARLDDALKEQAKLEERAHEEEEKVEVLENEKRELTRQHRELEAIYEAERAQTMKEKEDAQAREDELQDTIQRLKETMAMKNVPTSDGEEDRGHLSRTSSFRNNPSRSNSSQNLEGSGSFAPPSSIQRSNSRSNSKLIHQKDKIIEDLRLELAEVQIKLVEMENRDGGRMHELERQLLETRMTNARLMEDNESFQLLLQEKTLNGDLGRGDFLRSTSAQHESRAPSRNGPTTSLADELESAEVDERAVRLLEAEVNNLKDQNKALTLYINKIIGRLLSKQGFESVLSDDADDVGTGAGTLNTNKELPPPPPSKENEPQGFLQRAKSVALGGARKARPMSYTAAPVSTGTVNEDPTTAPSIPLQRSTSMRMPSGTYSHRRSTSEAPQPGAATVVNNMVRNAPSVASGPTSPSLVSPRNSIFGLPIGGQASNPASRVPSTGQPIPEENREPGSSEGGHVDTPSPPRRTDTGAGGVMTGKQMRPLRLVQNEEEAMRARKAANRGSWIAGWFGGGEQKNDSS